MAEEKVYRETYHDLKKKGHCQKTSYDKYRRRLQGRDMAQKKQEFEQRKIRVT